MPRKKAGTPPGERGGLQLSMNEVKPEATPVVDPAPELQFDAGSTREKSACQYCGKLFKNTARHELGCAKRPNAGATIPGIPPENVAALFRMTFAVVEKRAPEFALTDEECSALGVAWSPVMDQYLPAFLSKHGALFGAAVITITVFMPKYMEYQTRVSREARSRDNDRTIGDRQNITDAGSSGIQ